MTRREVLHELSQMSAADRILLVQDLWDTVADDPTASVLTPAQSRELERRLAEYRAVKARGEPPGETWDAVRGDIRERR